MRRRRPRWLKQLNKLKKNIAEKFSLKEVALFWVLIFGFGSSFQPISATGSFFSNSERTANAFMAGTWEGGPGPVIVPDIVLNELLPKPTGNDNDEENDNDEGCENNEGDKNDGKDKEDGQDGEDEENEEHGEPGETSKGKWVELYNNSDQPIDVAGYYITDHKGKQITVAGCRTNTGGTIINAKGFLVVYRNGRGGCNSHGFNLSVNGDTISLFNFTNQLLDSVIYTKHNVKPNKSIARIPDGIGEWVDPIPTPGKPNVLNGIEEVIFQPTSGIAPDSPLMPQPKPAPTPEPPLIENDSSGPSPIENPFIETPLALPTLSADSTLSAGSEQASSGQADEPIATPGATPTDEPLPTPDTTPSANSGLVSLPSAETPTLPILSEEQNRGSSILQPDPSNPGGIGTEPVITQEPVIIEMSPPSSGDSGSPATDTPPTAPEAPPADPAPAS